MNNNINKMRELPVSNRPYERCEAMGPQALSDAELVAIVLRSGTAQNSALDVALKLIKSYGNDHPLASIFNADIEELKEHDGIGRVKAILLNAVGEISRRITVEDCGNREMLSSPSLVANYYMESLRHLPYEEIHAALFDTKNHLLKDVLLSRGTANASIVTPREVLLAALKNKAVCFALVHNHPSGDPEPSVDDEMLTNRIKDAGAIVGIACIDHIIIGDNRYYSFNEKGKI